MANTHSYSLKLVWTGNKGEGTSTYRAYDRNYSISISGKPDLEGSADPMFRGDKSRHNPEDLLVCALSSCHLLSYLHLCASNGISVTSYEDNAIAAMELDSSGGGHFTEAVLRINMKITDPSKKDLAIRLHHDANKLCFIASSVNFPIKHEVTVE